MTSPIPSAHVEVWTAGPRSISAILAAGPGAYAGIGSRETPDDVLALMTRIAEHMASLGWVLRSGAAEGADTAFEAGVPVDGRAEIYLPWPTFGDDRKNFRWSQLRRSRVALAEPHQHAYAIAAEHHPAWHRLSRAAQRLQARNTHQVLGTPPMRKSRFIVCWTPDGAISETTMSTGGTGQAIRIAAAYEIPVFNLKLDEHRATFEVLVRKERGPASHPSSLLLHRMQAERTISAGEGMIEIGRKELARLEALEEGCRCGGQGFGLNGFHYPGADGCLRT